MGVWVFLGRLYTGKCSFCVDVLLNHTHLINIAITVNSNNHQVFKPELLCSGVVSKVKSHVSFVRMTASEYLTKADGTV